MRLTLPLLLSLGLLGFAPAAVAGTFDARGIFSLAPDTVAAESFDEGFAAQGIKFVVNETALEGSGYATVRVGRPSYRGPDLPLNLPAGKGRYRASFWARHNRVVASVAVAYDDEGSPSHDAVFYPTGRVTSDGWYEVATGPFSVDGTRAPQVTLSMYASGADVDAFELVSDGAFVEALACEGRGENRCGEGEFCAAGWCRNGDEMVPALPAPLDRAKLADAFAWRLRAFFGGRYSREHGLPAAIATLRQMRTAPTAWAFWNGLATALHRLHDWHTQINGPVDVAGRGAFPVCVDEGDADLSRAQAPSTDGLPDVLVTQVGPTQNSGLRVGDRIVAVDGQHPITWAESFEDLWWGSWHSNDPGGHAEALEKFRILVRRWAKELTIVRCDPATGTCGAPQLLPVSALPKDEPDIYPTCDHRPFYHLTSGRDPVTHDPPRTNGLAIDVGPIVENGPGERIHAMVWDDVIMFDPRQNPYEAALTRLRNDADGVILDHRTGNGGTEYAAEVLTRLFRRPALLGASTGFNGTVGLFDMPFDPAVGQAIVAARGAGDDGYRVGSETPKETMRAAVLLARDGSASDWWPEGMKGGGENIRLFGRTTAGAFSSFVTFDYFGGLGWQFASGDYVRNDGTTHLGEGVRPDEELVPKQSDLLAGRDTVFLRALEWVRTGR